MTSIQTGIPIPLEHLRTVHVQVVRILDCTLSEVADFSNQRMGRLEEWWFTPVAKLAWSDSDIAATGCRDLNQLLAKLQSDELFRPWLRKIQSHICEATLPKRSVSDFEWRLATRLIHDTDRVISVVYGDMAALEALATRRATAHANAWG